MGPQNPRIKGQGANGPQGPGTLVSKPRALGPGPFVCQDNGPWAQGSLYVKPRAYGPLVFQAKGPGPVGPSYLEAKGSWALDPCAQGLSYIEAKGPWAQCYDICSIG